MAAATSAVLTNDTTCLVPWLELGLESQNVTHAHVQKNDQKMWTFVIWTALLESLVNKFLYRGPSCRSPERLETCKLHRKRHDFEMGMCLPKFSQHGMQVSSGRLTVSDLG